MEKHTRLSDTELELMSFFWDNPRPVTFAEIFDYCNNVKNWNWAKTTAHTYITRLIQKNYLGIDNNSGTRRTYFARVSRDEFAQDSAQKLLDISFAGSMKNLILSLVPSRPLTQKDAEELYQMLDQIVKPEKNTDTDGSTERG